MAMNKNREFRPEEINRDARLPHQKVADFLRNPQNALFLAGFGAACSMIFPALTEMYFGLGMLSVTAAHIIKKKSGLPLRIPKSANMIDPKEENPETGKAVKSEGIFYVGNEIGTNEEVWLSDTMARTHMLFMGTTGSGKALSNRSKVLTPAGWVSMGQLKEGDMVCIPNGDQALVKGVYPQGRRRVYYIILQADAGIMKKVECCDEHLWSAMIDGDERVARTDEIIELFDKGAEIAFPMSNVSEDDGVFSAGVMRWIPVKRIVKGSMQMTTCISVDSKEHLFITDGGVVTHNTEFLISLVYNALVHGSGFIYVDGKADTSLYAKLYSMARSVGREDDVLVVNFQTGARDIFGPQAFKMSHTMNPFAVGSSGMVTQLIVSLMSSGKADVWENRAVSFVEALMKPLVYLRDHHGLLLDIGVIRDFLSLNRLEELAWSDANIYPGLEIALGGLHSYLNNLPTYDKQKFKAQGETCQEQHGYVTMQLIRTFNSLADTYGYIMKSQLAEIDFLDVFLNRRILIVLLPALEKSPAELTNLGRIIVASLKATMAAGLGSRIEGKWAKIIDTKPTTSPSPFPMVMDEYGYYAVEGFSVVPAQARSLGVSAVFAGQDLPAFQKASEKEAESTLANTNTKFCGKLECTKTGKYFNELASQGYYSKISGLKQEAGSINKTYYDQENITIDRFDRVTLDALRKQRSGAWHMFFAEEIIKIKSFFAAPKKIKELRVNHFMAVARPSREDAALFKRATEDFVTAIAAPGGLNNFIDTVPVREFIYIADGFDLAQASGVPLIAAAAISALHYAEVEKEYFNSFDKMLHALKPQQSSEGGEHFDGSEGDADASAHYEPSFDSAQVDQDRAARTGGPQMSDLLGQAGKFVDDEYSPGPEDVQSQSFNIAELEVDEQSSQVEPTSEAIEDSDDVFSNVRQLIGTNEFESDDALPEESFDTTGVSLTYMEGATVFGVMGGLDTTSGEVSGESELTPGELRRMNRMGKGKGMLVREQTEVGLSALDRAMGASENEAALNASATIDSLAQATTYAPALPVGEPTSEDFAELVSNISEALDEAMLRTTEHL